MIESSGTAPVITGSWIDVVHANARDGVYWNRCTLAYSAAEWRTLVRHLRRDLGVELLLLQNTAKDGGAVYPSKIESWQWHTRNCVDPVGALISACSAEGMKFYPGVGAPLAHHLGGPEPYSEAAFRWYAAMSEEMFGRYGAEPAWSGWYLFHEMAVRRGLFAPHEIAFARRLVDEWKRLTPGQPVIASPYFEGGWARIDPASSDELARQVEASGLDIIAYQDGVGVGTARQLESHAEAGNNAPLFEALRRVHDRTPCRLWANCETFSFENEIWGQPLIPAPFERIRQQCAGAAPFVDRIVAYIVPGTLTSQVVCPGLGAPETESRYADYRRYLTEVGHPARTG